MDDPSRSPSITPPPSLSTDGRERRIGVEVEFSNLDSRDAAQLVQRRFGGDIREKDPHRYTVASTEFGDFTVELDWRYAHKSDSDGAGSEAAARGGSAPSLTDELEKEFYSVLGDIGKLWLPVEIVAPPIPIMRLPELDVIINDLRMAGAQGTDEGLLFAFATQLNPEVPSLDANTIVNHLKAFLLLSDWLRREIDLDIKRRLLPFIDPFPKSYVRKVIDPSYQPDVAQLIDDYLEANPTRNRELDLLPLFAEIDEARVRSRVDDALIKARPTFHYRLPDTRLQNPAWSIVTEWNRWVHVEELATDDDRLRSTSEAFLARTSGWTPREWIKSLEGWLR